MGQWLLQNYGGGWTSNPFGSPYTMALPFVATAGGMVSAVRWYRATTGAPAPSRLDIWDASSGTSVWQSSATDPITDTGAVGWQQTTIADPISLTAGREYRVSWYGATGTNQAYEDAGLPSAIAGAGWTSQWRRYNSGSGATYPATGDSLHLPGIDAFLDPFGAPPPPPGVTTGDVQNALRDWLDTTEGTQAHSAPLLDHATLSAVNTNVSDVKDQQNEWAYGLGAAAHGYFGDLKGLIADIKTVTDTLPTPIAQLTSIMLDHYTDDIDSILAQIDSVLAGLSAQSSSLAGTSGSAVGALSGRSAFPATGWSMSAEESFTDSIAFGEPADAYVVNITSYQPTQPADSTAAGLWLPRLGWWCVLNGSLASQRGFVEFEQQLLTDQGRRMPACAIQLKPGTMATVQAWLLA